MFPDNDNDCGCCESSQPTTNVRGFDRIAYVNFINQLPNPESIQSITARSYGIEVSYNNTLLGANTQG